MPLLGFDWRLAWRMTARGGPLWGDQSACGARRTTLLSVIDERDCWGGRSGVKRQGAETSERVGDLAGPGPGGIEAQYETPPGAHQTPGGMPDAVAEPFRLAVGQFPDQAQALRPRREVLGYADDEQPRRVGGAGRNEPHR
jgi:hypothetical protein